MASRTISNSAEELLPENQLRRSFVVQNEDATINMFIKHERPGGLTVSTTDHDHRLGPGDAIGLTKDLDGDDAVLNRVTIVAASGTPRVSFFETENIRR